MGANNFHESPDKDSLEHFGILGMKWGVRRYQPYSSKPRKSGKKGKEIGEANKKNKSIFRSAKKAGQNQIRDEKIKLDRRQAYNNRRLLSDAELDRRINRLQREKRFRDLSEEDVFIGKAEAKKILKTAGVGLATIGITAAGKYYIRKRAGENVSGKDFAEYFKPKKK